STAALRRVGQYVAAAAHARTCRAGRVRICCRAVLALNIRTSGHPDRGRRPARDVGMLRRSHRWPRRAGAKCLSRPESMPPWLVSVAANAATVIEIYRFDFDAARRWQEWASPYQQQTNGPFATVYGHCLAGIAAKEELDIAEAERRFREALRAAKQCGGAHSHAARLACGLLGELMYERGDVDEAERLIEESCHLGSEGG